MKRASLKSMFAVVAVVALGAPQAAEAQSASINATATVLTPLTVSAGNDLDFGSVYPGVGTSIAPTAGAAGTFSLNGVANAEVDVSFTLPANLVSGGNSLPISFAATDGLWNTTNTSAGATTFDPSTGFTARVNAADGNMYVFLGGSVAPAGNQVAGDYSAQITLTAAYTGN